MLATRRSFTGTAVISPCLAYENADRSISYLWAFLSPCGGVRNSTPRCDGGRADGGGAALAFVELVARIVDGAVGTMRDNDDTTTTATM